MDRTCDAERVETGSVSVNDMAMTYGIAEAPFGGGKASGVGQVNGKQGIRNYCHVHPIISDKKTSGKLQGGYPYTRASADQMQKIVRIVFGNRLLRRLFT